MTLWLHKSLLGVCAVVVVLFFLNKHNVLQERFFSGNIFVHCAGLRFRKKDVHDFLNNHSSGTKAAASLPTICGKGH